MRPPTILALDASTEACSVALCHGEERISRWQLLPRGHAQRLLPMVEEVLVEADIGLTQLDLLGFCRGPGSFTGVRIGAGVAQGLAFGADLPVAPVSTLATLAQGAWRAQGSERVLAALDARMDEVYWGAYALEASCMRLQGEECVSTPEAVPLPKGDGWVGVGTGWNRYGAELSARMGDCVAGADEPELPHALDVLALAAAMWAAGECVSAEAAQPAYLRDNVVRS